jgi:hypothetical protein
MILSRTRKQRMVLLPNGLANIPSNDLIAEGDGQLPEKAKALSSVRKSMLSGFSTQYSLIFRSRYCSEASAKSVFS